MNDDKTRSNVPDDQKPTQPVDLDCEPTLGDVADPDRADLQRRLEERVNASGARIRHDPLIGQTFGGRFEIVSKIGTGGMGVVYKASQKGMDRNVAIKVLLKEYLTNETAVRRFEREALAVSRLEHPNTVRIYDFGETSEGLLYIAMEFLSGAPLARVLTQDRQLAVRRVLRVVRQICLSLDEAHRKGIIHRDLKPDNVFVGDVEGVRDYVKVLDFGVAKLREGADEGGTLTQHGVIFGTPKYMSPEQCKSQGLDPRSDLYSVGVMMYEMLAGRVPFEADNSMAILIMHANDQAAAIQDVRPDLVVPFEVEELMHRLLAKEPGDRPRDAKAVVKACDRLLQMVPDEFERVITHADAEKAGMSYDRSQAYTVPDNSMRVSDSERLAIARRDAAQSRDTMAVETSPYPTPLWKKLALAAGALVVVMGIGAGVVYSQLTGLPEGARALIPAASATAQITAPAPDTVKVTVEANVANVTVVDPATGRVLGELPEAGEARTFEWLREPGRTVPIVLKHGTSAPITRQIDLGKDNALGAVTFEVAAGQPAAERVTLTVTTNVGGAYVKVEGLDAVYPIPGDGTPTRAIELIKGDTERKVTVEKLGYLTVTKAFTPAEDGALTVELEPDPAASPAPEPARITVKTNVGNVEVRVASTGQVFRTPKRRGEPLTIPLERGDASVKLSLDRPGYEPQELEVVPDQDREVAVSLERRRRRPPPDRETASDSNRPGPGESDKPPKDDGSIKIGPFKRIR